MTTAKDLYKKLSRNKPSEELFGLEKQPENTCPMIDSTISDLRSFRGRVGTLKWKLKEYLDLPPVSCHMQENISFFHDVKNILDVLDNWDKAYISLEKELEVLRSYLESIRSASTSYKESLWSAIDNSIEIDEKEMTITKKSRSWSSAGSLRTRHDNSNVEDKVQDIKSLEAISFINNYPECPECGLSEVKQEVLDLINDIDPNIFSERPLDEQINQNHLEEWVESVSRLHITNVGDYFLSFVQSHGFEIK